MIIIWNYNKKNAKICNDEEKQRGQLQRQGGLSAEKFSSLYTCTVAVVIYQNFS